MTDEDGAPRFLFVETIEPLSLVDPGVAAQFLDVERHSLACYRSLGIGPAYYKFGRWIRYGARDLHQWAGLPPGAPDDWRAELFSRTGGTTAFVDMPTAARFLTVTRHCLSNYRITGDGPPLRRFGRRIYYAVDELVEWAVRQRKPGTHG